MVNMRANHSFPCIYEIRNLATGKIYIGATTDIIQRERYRFCRLRNNGHFNNSLQNDFNYYEEPAFFLRTLVIAEENILPLLEGKLIKIHKNKNTCYNEFGRTIISQKRNSN